MSDERCCAVLELAGIIVLPCGAGKTLTGVTAAATIQKGVIVLANTNVSALQWKVGGPPTVADEPQLTSWCLNLDLNTDHLVEPTGAQFRQWTTMADDEIIKFTSKDSQILPQKPVILITTYSMLSFTGGAMGPCAASSSRSAAESGDS